MNRRTFLGVAAGAAWNGTARTQDTPIPVIDAHIHLFDPARPDPFFVKAGDIVRFTAIDETVFAQLASASAATP